MLEMVTQRYALYGGEDVYCGHLRWQFCVALKATLGQNLEIYWALAHAVFGPVSPHVHHTHYSIFLVIAAG